MDKIDKVILAKLVENARVPLNKIAAAVKLTPPAVSERIKKMERDGTIGGYTVRMGYPEGKETVSAFIDITAFPEKKEDLKKRIVDEPLVRSCCSVTGSRNYVLQVHCPNISTLEKLLTELQQYGQTNTQIILSTLVSRES